MLGSNGKMYILNNFLLGGCRVQVGIKCFVYFSLKFKFSRCSLKGFGKAQVKFSHHQNTLI